MGQDHLINFFILSEGLNQIKRSNYCDGVIEHLFLPMTEAAVKLPQEEQKNFIYLMATVFYHEYRKVITSNKRLYRYTLIASTVTYLARPHP